MTLASLSQHPGEHCRSYGREKHAFPYGLSFRPRRAGGHARSMRRDPAAAVMRRGSAALHRQGRLIEIELLELVALGLVIGSLAQIDEPAPLGRARSMRLASRQRRFVRFREGHQALTSYSSWSTTFPVRV